ncbi:peptide-methionine (S)-S-oxide reductase MsrA [Candidatus Woesebacteria bacterium]|nr:peptide-methionine (S)-S-oxide reductase MsrA [Candidatus Woesebacteria bacterium]
MEVATLAGGCFWCTEAIFRRLNGVSKVTSGYTGGKTENPTYEQVCTGTTGHAEAVQIEFDPAIIQYETILEVFMATHDPTTLNQQGNDIGTQYRSAIFYHSEEQKKVAQKAVSEVKGAVTEIVPYTTFYPAEIDHQQYYEINGKAGYCTYVIDPKIHKLIEKYGDLVKPGYK